MKLSRLKHYIKQIMPYRWVLEYEEKRDFYAQYFAWKETNPKVEFDKDNKWENIVSIEGFGYSGSGAVVDLLREYDDCLVHGMAEGGSKAVEAADDFGEIELLTYPGGLIDLDTALEKPSLIHQDAAIKRFGKLMFRDRIYNLGAKYRKYIYLFFDSMIDDVIRDTKGSWSPMVPRLKDNIFTLRDYNKKDYYALCQQFLYSIFNQQYNGSCKYLVLDQLYLSTKMGIEYGRNFLPNMKNIVVWRDPRDIYTIALRQDIQWLPHDTVEHFIKIMSHRYGNLKIDSKEYLSIRFEDLILDYDKTVGKIEKYLNLGEHKRPQSCLDISISCKNVGMWKTATDIPQEDYEKIQKAMPQFCYDK